MFYFNFIFNISPQAWKLDHGSSKVQDFTDIFNKSGLGWSITLILILCI